MMQTEPGTHSEQSKPPRQRLLWYILCAVFLIVIPLIAMLLGWISNSVQQDERSRHNLEVVSLPTASNAPQVAAPSKREPAAQEPGIAKREPVVVPDLHREMVLIPPVEFTFPGWGMEAPYKGYSEPFYIDRYEVSCVRYQAFLDATGFPPPDPIYWPDGRFPVGAENLPAFDVTWEGAAAFAKWEGKRLPTVLEWELAAGGADGRKFPWGDEGDVHILNEFSNTYHQLVRGKAHHEYLAPIDSYPNGVSPFGVFNMVGNVMEWTATEVGRGGHYLKGSIRDRLAYGCVGDDFVVAYVGFRCALSVEGREEEELKTTKPAATEETAPTSAHPG